MLVVSEKFGLLGNRLMAFAHLIAASCENDFTVINPAFGEYAPYFEGTANNLCCAFPLPSIQFPISTKARNVIERVATRAESVAQCLSWTGIQCLPSQGDICINRDANSPDFVAEAKKLAFTNGWRIFNGSNIKKHAKTVKTFFTPIRPIRDEIDKTIAAARVDVDVLVGVHIRHGDFDKWYEGRYYYTTVQYAQWMHQMVALFPNRRVGFLICSNVSQNKDDFVGLTHTFGPGDMIGDLYALAKCDYLIATLTTFARWASFYGNVPTCLVHDPKIQFSHSDFVIYDEILSPPGITHDNADLNLTVTT